MPLRVKGYEAGDPNDYNRPLNEPHRNFGIPTFIEGVVGPARTLIGHVQAGITRFRDYVRRNVIHITEHTTQRVDSPSSILPSVLPPTKPGSYGTAVPKITPRAGTATTMPGIAPAITIPARASATTIPSGTPTAGSSIAPVSSGRPPATKNPTSTSSSASPHIAPNSLQGILHNGAHLYINQPQPWEWNTPYTCDLWYDDMKQIHGENRDAAWDQTYAGRIVHTNSAICDLADERMQNMKDAFANRNLGVAVGRPTTTKEDAYKKLENWDKSEEAKRLEKEKKEALSLIKHEDQRNVVHNHYTRFLNQASSSRQDKEELKRMSEGWKQVYADMLSAEPEINRLNHHSNAEHTKRHKEYFDKKRAIETLLYSIETLLAEDDMRIVQEKARKEFYKKAIKEIEEYKIPEEKKEEETAKEEDKKNDTSGNTSPDKKDVVGVPLISEDSMKMIMSYVKKSITEFTDDWTNFQDKSLEKTKNYMSDLLGNIEDIYLNSILNKKQIQNMQKVVEEAINAKFAEDDFTSLLKKDVTNALTEVGNLISSTIESHLKSLETAKT